MRVNYAKNPSLETNTLGWSSVYDGVLTRVTSEHHTGSAALEVVTAPETDSGCRYEVPAPIGAGSTFVCGVWVKGPIGENLIFAIEVGNTEDYSGFAVAEDCTGDWQYLVIDYPVEFWETPTYIAAVINLNSVSSPATTFYVDSLIIEAGDTIGTYFDGDTPNEPSVWYEWESTPHNSISYTTGITLPERDIPEPYGTVVSNSAKSNMTVTYRSGWLG